VSDIFVSYASPDRDAAFRIVAFLEQNGIRCWVAPRDDTVLMRVDHPQASSWDVRTRVLAIEGGFEFQPLDAPADEKNIARFAIVDDSTLKLTRADGEAQDGPIRVRCPAK
jgi:hypothetical protein